MSLLSYSEVKGSVSIVRVIRTVCGKKTDFASYQRKHVLKSVDIRSPLRRTSSVAQLRRMLEASRTSEDDRRIGRANILVKELRRFWKPRWKEELQGTQLAFRRLPDLRNLRRSERYANHRHIITSRESILQGG